MKINNESIRNKKLTIVWAVEIVEVDMGKLGGVLVGGGITKGAMAEVISENE